MAICVFTDTHANLPALEALLNAPDVAACHHLVHLGDAIGIGPHPAECLDLLLGQPSIDFVMGNHDEWFAHGLPVPQPDWMSNGELAHQLWTHRQLNPELKEAVASWPFSLRTTIGECRLDFVHYPRAGEGAGFHDIVRQPTAAQMDALFDNHNDADIVFYGHHHPFGDVQSLARYINPGSLGCYERPVARYTLVDAVDSVDEMNEALQIEHRSVPYDDRRLSQDFVDRNVPERALLNRFFFGGRLGI